MQGRRVYIDNCGNLVLREGDYGKDAFGHWYGRVPGHHIANLRNHEIIEYEDGTITVNPSIQIESTRPDPNDPNKMIPVELWHGHLIKGVWSAV